MASMARREDAWDPATLINRALREQIIRAQQEMFERAMYRGYPGKSGPRLDAVDLVLHDGVWMVPEDAEQRKRLVFSGQ
jgi:hypothetical protein